MTTSLCRSKIVLTYVPTNSFAAVRIVSAYIAGRRNGLDLDRRESSAGPKTACPDGVTIPELSLRGRKITAKDRDCRCRKSYPYNQSAKSKELVNKSKE
jgi:hypothetical protein